MINTERTILGCFIRNSALIHPGLEDLFQESLDHRDIYMKMLRLGEFDLVILADNLKGKVLATRLSDLLNLTTHIRQENLSSYVNGLIYKLKEERWRKEFLQEVRKQLESPVTDLREIKDMMHELVFSEVEEGADIDRAVKSLLEIREMTAEITLGFPSIDGIIGGFRKGELVLIMGRTTTGKTWILLNALNHLVSKQVGKIGFFSLEMPDFSIAERLLQLYFGKSREEINKKFLAEPLTEMDQFNQTFANTTFYTAICSPQDINVVIKKDKLEVIFIDFLGLMKSSRFSSSYERVTELISELKKIAKEEEVLIILAHQLSRQAEDGSIPVKLHHARDSGAVEELSDFVVGIWRPEISSGNYEARDKLFMSLLKNKRGETGSIECHFDKNSGKITEI